MEKNILIVEDNDAVRDALIDCLSELGYAAEGATNGKTALELLAAAPGKFRLIFLDLMMPVMNGWEFRARQLADPAFAGIPVVVVSANLNIQDEAEWLGAKGILRKPFLLEDLGSQTRRFL